MNTPVITSLADKALLVRLQRSMYQPYAYSKEATNLVSNTMGVGADAGRFNKRLVKGCKELDVCNAAFGKLSRTFRDHTVPWLDDGIRMCPNTSYFELAAMLRELIAEANKAADALVAAWPKVVAQDMVRLGVLFDERDYPSQSELRKKFDATVQFLPVPSTNDFRVEIDEDDRKPQESRIKQVEADTAKYLVGEMLEPIQRFVDKLSIPIGEGGAIFRDSMVENMVELLGRLPKLNINNDPTVDKAIKDLKAIITPYAENIDLLRQVPEIRVSAKDRMARLQSDLSAFMQAA